MNREFEDESAMNLETEEMDYWWMKRNEMEFGRRDWWDLREETIGWNFLFWERIWSKIEFVGKRFVLRNGRLEKESGKLLVGTILYFGGLSNGLF